MLQQVVVAPGKIEFREVPIPEIGPDQVLVRIKRIGIFAFLTSRFAFRAIIPE